MVTDEDKDAMEDSAVMTGLDRKAELNPDGSEEWRLIPRPVGPGLRGSRGPTSA